MNDAVILIVMILALLGPSLVIAAVGYASIHALGRNPSSAPKIMLGMIVALIFSGALTLIALLIFFHLYAT